MGSKRTFSISRSEFSLGRSSFAFFEEGEAGGEVASLGEGEEGVIEGERTGEERATLGLPRGPENGYNDPEDFVFRRFGEDCERVDDDGRDEVVTGSAGGGREAATASREGGWRGLERKSANRSSYERGRERTSAKAAIS